MDKHLVFPIGTKGLPLGRTFGFPIASKNLRAIFGAVINFEIVLTSLIELTPPLSIGPRR